jgi:hypothetical protein
MKINKRNLFPQKRNKNKNGFVKKIQIKKIRKTKT